MPAAATARQPAYSFRWPSRESLFYSTRVALAIACVLATIGVFPTSFEQLWERFARPDGIPKQESVPWHEASKSALESQQALTNSLFQTALIAMGGMWGVFLVKREEAALVLHDWPEKLMVCCATAALAFSTLGYFYYSRSLANIALDAAVTGSVVDLTSWDVSFSLLSQCLCIVGGVLMASCAVGSALWLHPAVNPTTQATQKP